MNKKLTKLEKIKIGTTIKEIKKVITQKKLGFAFIILGITSILILGNIWLNRNFQVNQSDIISLEGRIADKIQINRVKFSYNSMVIRLNEFPNIEFNVDRFGVNSGQVIFLGSKAKIGDTIYLDVIKNELHKIDNTKKSKIYVYGIRDKKTEYLELKDYKFKLKADRNSISMYILLGLSFTLLGYGIFLFYNQYF